SSALFDRLSVCIDGAHHPVCGNRSHQRDGPRKDLPYECRALAQPVIAVQDPSTHVSAAANYFSSVLTNGVRLGLSFGRMLSAMAPLLPAGTVSNLDISMLLGGFGRAMPGIQGHELARHIASLYPHGRIHYLQAPLLVDSPDIRQAMLIEVV